MKKIVCLIENLGAGGAERQISYLAVLLKQQGYDVEVWYYIKREFHLPYLQKNGVFVRFIQGAESLKNRFRAIKQLIASNKPDTIISYSASTSIIACALKLLGNNFNLIVSERSTTQNLSLRDRIRFIAYRWADYIVPNSFSQASYIEAHFKNLSKKIKVITNFIDTKTFVPKAKSNTQLKTTNIICVGRLVPAKNIPVFIDAINKIVADGYDIAVDWFGQQTNNKEYAALCFSKVKQYNLDNIFIFHEACEDIASQYQAADIFCMPSIYEGFPNVLCEAMSCGLPVVCSDVSDVKNIMENNINGYLFNPNDVNDMTATIKRILQISKEERKKMSLHSRKLAEEHFSTDFFVAKYKEII